MSVLTGPGWAEGAQCWGPVFGVFSCPPDLFGLLLPGPEVARLFSPLETVQVGSSAIFFNISCWGEFKSQIVKQKLK